MARYDHYFPNDQSCVPETQAHIDELIRSGLLKAFHLPRPEHQGDEKFRLLLDALAQASQVGS